MRSPDGRIGGIAAIGERGGLCAAARRRVRGEGERAGTSTMHVQLFLLLLALVFSTGESVEWVGLTGDRNKELTKCAANFGGAVKFVPDNSWPAKTTGDGSYFPQ
eukprot:COSAG02_NODE_3895_length_6073_cov_2.783562_8_plen_105_part_00